VLIEIADTPRSRNWPIPIANRSSGFYGTVKGSKALSVPGLSFGRDVLEIGPHPDEPFNEFLHKSSKPEGICGQLRIEDLSDVIENSSCGAPGVIRTPDLLVRSQEPAHYQ
jgi:hypothetical protein